MHYIIAYEGYVFLTDNPSVVFVLNALNGAWHTCRYNATIWLLNICLLVCANTAEGLKNDIDLESLFVKFVSGKLKLLAWKVCNVLAQPKITQVVYHVLAVHLRGQCSSFATHSYTSNRTYNRTSLGRHSIYTCQKSQRPHILQLLWFHSWAWALEGNPRNTPCRPYERWNKNTNYNKIHLANSFLTPHVRTESLFSKMSVPGALQVLTIQTITSWYVYGGHNRVYWVGAASQRRTRIDTRPFECSVMGWTWCQSTLMVKVAMQLSPQSVLQAWGEKRHSIRN